MAQGSRSLQDSNKCLAAPHTVTHSLSDAVFKTAEELDWKSFSGEWIQTIHAAPSVAHPR